MKKIAVVGLLVFLLGMPALGLADVTQSDRLLQRPEWDGAVMPSPWIDGGLNYETWDDDGLDATVWSVGATFIAPLPNVPKLELGGRLDLMTFDPDGYDSETGLSDIDLWGKYQLYKDAQMMIAAGLLITLPTGSEDVIHAHASGEFNIEVFGAGRYQVDRSLAVIGHLALRENSDMDIKLGNATGEVEGETQFELGGGTIYEINSQLEVQGELNFASEAYDNFENDIQLRGGLAYKLTPSAALKGGLSLGLDDGAPDWALTFRFGYLF